MAARPARTSRRRWTAIWLRGVCGVFIADKLGVTQPTLSEHMRIHEAVRAVENSL